MTVLFTAFGLMLSAVWSDLFALIAVATRASAGVAEVKECIGCLGRFPNLAGRELRELVPEIGGRVKRGDHIRNPAPPKD